MLSKDIKDTFLNTYFKDEEQVYITELYDKWRRNPPKVLKVSYSKDEAVKNHEAILTQLESKMRRKQV
jgi:hypothetical protein